MEMELPDPHPPIPACPVLPWTRQSICLNIFHSWCAVILFKDKNQVLCPSSAPVSPDPRICWLLSEPPDAPLEEEDGQALGFSMEHGGGLGEGWQSQRLKAMGLTHHLPAVLLSPLSLFTFVLKDSQ